MTQVQRRKASEDKPDLTLMIDGTPYPLRVNEVTGSVVAQLRRESTMSWVSVLSTLSGGGAADLDMLAAVMCVSRWQRGLEGSYEAACDGLNYSTKFELRFGDDTPDEAPDADPND